METLVGTLLDSQRGSVPDFLLLTVNRQVRGYISFVGTITTVKGLPRNRSGCELPL